ncbi:trypsin-like serine peptidase [Streptomyces sp. BI20]|uniref:trypsin-like serine peptidase n=1 Tax=Streptomyces sp. BI20 TaxID=3403460 RepID=UPI003C756D54
MIDRALSHRSPRARRAVRSAAALLAVAGLVSLTGPAAAATGLPAGVTREAAATPSTARVGALFAGDLDAGHHCTASVVRSAGRDVIVTAAHCLDGDPSGMLFAPGFRDGATPYGVWPLTAVVTDPAWSAGQDPDADVAFATVAPVDGREVEDVVGGFPLADTDPTDPTVTVIGYPRSQDTPLTCTNATDSISDTQRRIACPDLTGGTSGSPWIASDGSLVGVLGGYEGGGTVPEISYSAVLGPTARALYARVDTTTSAPC